MSKYTPPTSRGSIFNLNNYPSNTTEYLQRDVNESVTGTYSFSNRLTCSNLTCDTDLIKTDGTSNYVGINKSTPTCALDVTGATKVSGNMTVNTNVLAVDASGAKVGINNASPTCALDVTGAAKISGNVAVNTNTLAIDAAQAYVGVNNASPAYALDVTGDINSTANIRIGGTAILTSTNLGGVSVSNNLVTLRGAHTSTTGHMMGCTNIVNTTNNGGTTAIGSYYKMVGWDTAGASHTISFATFAINAGNDNIMGTLKIFCSNKASTTPKVGILTADVLKAYGINTSISTIATSKSANLTALSVTNSTNNLTVTTDSDCKISWIFIAAM